MNKTFEFDSDHFGIDYVKTFVVEIEIWASAEDEGDCEIISIYSKGTEIQMKLEDFPKNEQERMMKEAYEVCDEFTHVAWQAACEAQGDAMYQAWKEGEYGNQE